MASLEEIRKARMEKLGLLKSKGISPYPIESRQDITCADAVRDFETHATSGESKYMVGRILSIRSQGQIIFADFNDGTGRFQAFLKKGEPMSERDFELFEQAFDIGDFVEIRGTFFLTKKDEKTVLVEEVRMLAKSLRPLPEKWHGLQDVEERFRKRYLDIL
ncbi:MAG: OB-fold nucleic acid binding domain-containing protein, partial [bacterium]|nr:OB-fold nucleic acid binding domain-containing protein [bacterium]